MLDNLGKIGIVVCAGFLTLAAVSFILPLIDEMYIPLYGTDPRVAGFSEPSSDHILGTDFMGRDIFSQLCRGAFTALFNGAIRAALGVPVLSCAALVLARIRSEPPQLEDTLLTRYVRFIGFPLCVVGLASFLTGTFVLVGPKTLSSWVLFAAVIFAYLGWLAVGHDLETTFRNKEKIPVRLLLTFVALIISYNTLYDGVLNLFGMGDPGAVAWGTMVQWCFTSGHTFRAPFWLIPPILCTYIFSRGMLALGYSMYNADSRKYFFKKKWM